MTKFALFPMSPPVPLTRSRMSRRQGRVSAEGPTPSGHHRATRVRIQLPGLRLEASGRPRPRRPLGRLQVQAVRLCTMVDEADEQVALAVALVMRALRGDLVCIDLSSVAGQVDVADLPWPEPASCRCSCSRSHPLRCRRRVVRLLSDLASSTTRSITATKMDRTRSRGRPDRGIGWSPWRKRSTRLGPLREFWPNSAHCTRTTSRDDCGTAAWPIRTPYWTRFSTKPSVRQGSWSTIGGCGCRRC